MQNNSIQPEPRSLVAFERATAARSSEADKRKEKFVHAEGQSSRASESRPSTSSVTFQVNPESGRISIHVIDQESGEIIREIPPEELQRLASALDEISGRLINTSA